MGASEYPKTSVLRQGVILGSIVNATMIAQNPEYARFLSWDGRNYVLNGGDGTYGAIAFHQPFVVGLFFDAHSKYNPIGSEDKYEIDRFFRGISTHRRLLAETEALRYNQQNYQGKTVPLVTAAFWDEGEYLTAVFPWKEVLDNGAHIIRVELMEDVEAALEEWRDAYQMSLSQVSLARSVFERKIANPDTIVELGAHEIDTLLATSESADATEHCRRAFEMSGVRMS